MSYDQRHGGPYDRGGADAYYGRPYSPHYFRKDTYSSPKYEQHEMTPGQIEEYAAGYNDCDSRKDY
jgi:hypothetical protein